MTVQFSLAVRTLKAAAVQTVVGIRRNGTLNLFASALPANCAAADPPGRLITIHLPNVFLAASSGANSLVGTWSGFADVGGTPLCYRIYDSDGFCHEQGDATNFSFSPPQFSGGQPVTITAHTGIEGGA